MQISPLCEGSAGFGVSREGADQSRCECAVLTVSAGFRVSREGAVQSRSVYPVLTLCIFCILVSQGWEVNEHGREGQQEALVQLRRAEGAASLSGGSVLLSL